MTVKGRMVPIPNLDNQDWQYIKDEMIKKIPELCPQWTDWNASDPGITLIELFAQAIEELLYKQNQVLPKHLKEYLNMIGVTLTPPSAAKVRTYFKLSEALNFDVVLSSGFETAAMTGDEPVIFTTDEELIIHAAKLLALIGFQNHGITDSTVLANEGTTSFNPMPYSWESTDFLAFGLYENNYFQKLKVTIDVPMQGDYEGVWEYYRLLPDYTGEWTRLDVTDTTNQFKQSGEITFELPSDWGPYEVNGVKANWLTFHLRSQNGNVIFATISKLEIDDITGVVSSSNVKVINEEIIGSGTGIPDQHYYLNHVPVLDMSLYVDEGQGFERWQEVEDFIQSQSEDKHYVLNKGTGEISFGDGIHGKAPVLGANNIKAMPYRYGGGTRGNVAPNTITQLRNAHVYIDSCFNLEAAKGGGDEETIEECVKRGPSEQLRTRNRAVTNEDYETLALESSTAVARALALPLFNPADPMNDMPGVVSVIVMPKEGETISLALREHIKTYLDKRRLVTAQLYIIDPEYQSIEIIASVKKEQQQDTNILKSKIENTVREFFDPLNGGDTRLAVTYVQGTSKERGNGWIFGRNVYLSELYELLERISGVDHVESISSPAGNIAIAKNQMPRLSNVVIEVI